jgi:hypothetical protein
MTTMQASNISDKSNENTGFEPVALAQLLRVGADFCPQECMLRGFQND